MKKMDRLRTKDEFPHKIHMSKNSRTVGWAPRIGPPESRANATFHRRLCVDTRRTTKSVPVFQPYPAPAPPIIWSTPTCPSRTSNRAKPLPLLGGAESRTSATFVHEFNANETTATPASTPPGLSSEAGREQNFVRRAQHAQTCMEHIRTKCNIPHSIESTFSDSVAQRGNGAGAYQVHRVGHGI
jgi:hypothetical protein